MSRKGQELLRELREAAEQQRNNPMIPKSARRSMFGTVELLGDISARLDRLEAAVARIDETLSAMEDVIAGELVRPDRGGRLGNDETKPENLDHGARSSN